MDSALAVIPPEPELKQVIVFHFFCTEGGIVVLIILMLTSLNLS